MFILCCFDGSFAPAMSQYTELEELEAVLELGKEFNKSARFQKPTTVNEIEQRERDRIPKKTQQSTVWLVTVYRAWAE